jgi:lipopolysaccharide export LptBFGC system permease protein LptF
MVILKKIKSATLVEALIATVLIVIVFMIASLILNNLVLNTLSKNTHNVENRLNELEYDLQNKIIKLPYNETFEDWDITIETLVENSNTIVNMYAINQNKNKQIERKALYE